ncbi:hypothetical protein IIA79_08075, partial [bacterium]|nr:hypothetical protein [bacterium]
KQGTALRLPLYVFNLLGDANADNMVDQLDLDAFAPVLGLSSADEGYSPFFDSDLSGVITEDDAAAVGYFWGSRISD